MYFLGCGKHLSPIWVRDILIPLGACESLCCCVGRAFAGTLSSGDFPISLQSPKSHLAACQDQSFSGEVPARRCRAGRVSRAVLCEGEAMEHAECHLPGVRAQPISPCVQFPLGNTQLKSLLLPSVAALHATVFSCTCAFLTYSEKC